MHTSIRVSRIMAETRVISQRIGFLVSMWFLIILIQWAGIGAKAYAERPNAPSPPATPKVSDTLTDGIASAKEERLEFEHYIRKQFHDLEKKAEALREKGAELHETTKSKLNDKFENLKEQKQELLMKIKDLRNTSENAWKDIRKGILDTMNNLEQSMVPSTSAK